MVHIINKYSIIFYKICIDAFLQKYLNSNLLKYKSSIHVYVDLDIKLI